MPVFVYKNKEIYLSKQQCLSLELILNISDEYKYFINLGNKLYNSFIEREEYHTISVEEFNWLTHNINFLK